MTLGLDESLEDYEEIFQLNYRRDNYTPDLESLKLVLLEGIEEDVMETLNILSTGDTLGEFWGLKWASKKNVQLK